MNPDDTSMRNTVEEKLKDFFGKSELLIQTIHCILHHIMPLLIPILMRTRYHTLPMLIPIFIHTMYHSINHSIWVQYLTTHIVKIYAKKHMSSAQKRMIHVGILFL